MIEREAFGVFLGDELLDFSWEQDDAETYCDRYLSIKFDPLEIMRLSVRIEIAGRVDSPVLQAH